MSSGSACSSASGSGGGASPVLQAMGLPEPEAASGVRFSLGPWLAPEDLEGVAAALERARTAVARAG